MPDNPMHDEYRAWPVLMSINKAAELLGVDRKTLTGYCES